MAKIFLERNCIGSRKSGNLALKLSWLCRKLPRWKRTNHLIVNNGREIQNMKNTMLKTAVVILGVGLLAGCASSDKMTKMEADIANAQATADAAMQAAKQAQLDAASAQGTADSAMSAANAAQAASDECSERCSRMSEKAFAK